MAQPLLSLPPVLFFWSVLYRHDLLDRAKLESELALHLKALLIWSADLPPKLCQYYAHEMGEGLTRFFAVSLQPRDRSELVAEKMKALLIEKITAIDNRRVINIDPGFLSLEQVVLSTAKPYAHRIFLAPGVFAELTLQFQAGEFHALPWTYPDYSDAQHLELFHFLRSFLRTRETRYK